MKDYYADLVMSVLVWLVWGMLYVFGFRRSTSPYIRSISKYNGIAWACLTGWVIYNLVMWKRSP